MENKINNTQHAASTRMKRISILYFSFIYPSQWLWQCKHIIRELVFSTLINVAHRPNLLKNLMKLIKLLVKPTLDGRLFITLKVKHNVRRGKQVVFFQNTKLIGLCHRKVCTHFKACETRYWSPLKLNLLKNPLVVIAFQEDFNHFAKNHVCIIGPVFL